MTNRPAPSLATFVRLQIGVIALLVAQFVAPHSVSAQGPDEVIDDGPPFTESCGGVIDVGKTPLRVWLQTGGYGQEDGQFSVGTRQATQTDNGVAFFDAQYNLKASKTFGVNVGGGVRSFFETSLDPGKIGILGASVWYDGDETESMNYFNQVGFSLECLWTDWDIRVNANLPFGGKTQQANDFDVTNTPVFVGNFLARQAFVKTDFAVDVIDVEVARRLGEENAWVYAGGYNLQGEVQSGAGYTVGVRGYVNDDLLVNVSVSDDDMYQTSVMVGLVLTPGRTQGLWGCPHTITDRLREPVMRKNYIATRQERIETGIPLTDADGNNIRVVHVDSTEMAPGGGDGSFAAPFVRLDDVFAGSFAGDIVLMHSGTTHAGQLLRVKDEQRALGEGAFRTHSVVTTELGTIDVPETAPGAVGGPIPMITAAPGTAITLVTGTMSVSAFDEIEISNVFIDGGARGIASPTGVGAVNINRVTIEDTIINGIELTPLVETLADGTTQVRFNTTIDDVILKGIGGNGIDLDSTTTAPVAAPVVEAIAISDVFSTGGIGRAIRINDNKSEATITDFTHDGFASSGGGILLSEAEADVTVTRATIVRGVGPGIEIRDTDAMFSITESTITDTVGAALLVGAGASTVDFTGFIDQGGAGSAFTANGGHTGTVTFTEQTAGMGVISATLGTGLLFDGADGVYTFNNRVTLAGGDAGIDFIGGSAVVTMPEAFITSPTGTAVNAVGGSGSLTFTGEIEQANAASVVSVSGGHTGTFIFNEFTAGAGVVSASAGDGLQFNTANGAYTFNHDVDLAGGDAGLDIIGGSTGTFTFDALNITDPTGTALNINGSEAIATIDGTITNAAGRVVEIVANTGGSSTIVADIIGTGDGVLVTSNTGGTFSFMGNVDLTTGASTAVTVNNNTETAVSFNGGLDITTTSGAGFLSSGSSTVATTGSNNTIQSTTGIALHLNTVEIAGAGINFMSVSADGAASGIQLVNLTGGALNIGASGTSAGDGGMIMNTTGAGVSVTNAANVSLNNLLVDTTGDDGISITQSDGNTSSVSVIDSAIRNTSMLGIDLVDSGSGILTFVARRNSIDNNGDENLGFVVGGSATVTNLTVDDNVIVNSSGDEALRFVGDGAAAKTVNLLVTNNQFTNDDPAAVAANFLVPGAVNLNATVTDNQFVNNAAAGLAFRMSASGAGANVRLNIEDNIGTSIGVDYRLIHTGGSFSMEDLPDGMGNIGTFDTDATIVADPGPIPLP